MKLEYETDYWYKNPKMGRHWHYWRDPEQNEGKIHQSNPEQLKFVRLQVGTIHKFHPEHLLVFKARRGDNPLVKHLLGAGGGSRRGGGGVTDYVIWGPMRGLKMNYMEMGHINGEGTYKYIHGHREY